MAEKSIVCPNCGGPVPPNTTSASLSCGYCKHHFKNPLYEKPQRQRPAPAPSRSSGSEKTVLAIVLISILGFPLIIGGIIFGIYSFAVSQNEAYSKRMREAQARAAPTIPNAGETEPEAPLPKDVQREKKLDIYIDCVSDSFPTAEHAMDRYRAWMKTPKKGPSCKERYISYGLHDLSDSVVKRCEKMAEANGMSPSMPEVQAAASAHLKALKAAKPVFDDANSYYNQKRYTLDNCEGAQKIHPNLMRTYADVEATYHSLYNLVLKHSKGTLARCLARTGKDPELKAAHEWAAFMIFSQQLVNTFGEEAKKKKPNVKLLKQIASKALDKSEALLSLLKASSQSPGFRHLANSDIASFTQSVREFANAEGGKKLNHSARFFIRHGNARRNYEGTYENLIKTFNGALDRYNSYNKTCGALLPCTESGCPER